MTKEERFLQELAQGVIEAGGATQEEPEKAMAIAREAHEGLKALEDRSYPGIVEIGELRFVYQWDQRPPLLTIMVWVDVMWRDMARIAVPPGVI